MNELFHRIVAKGAEHCDPTQVKIELTETCNLRCQHCYQDHHRTPELGLDDYCRLFDSLVRENTLVLVFTGGEPMVRKDFLDIVHEAWIRGFYLAVLSNATLVDEPTAKFLREHRVAEFQVSLYGHCAEVHDTITGVPGSFARTLRGIERLRAVGIRVRIASCVLRPNVEHWRSIRQFVERDLGLRLNMTYWIYETEANATRLASCTLDPEGVRAYLADVYSQVTPRAPTPATAADLEQIICLAAINNCRILPNGDVLACALLEEPMGNVLGSDFGTIWRESPVGNRIRRLRRRDLAKCSSCANFSICPICPGYFAGYDSSLAPPERVCRLVGIDAQERAWVLGNQRSEVPAEYEYPEPCESI